MDLGRPPGEGGPDIPHLGREGISQESCVWMTVAPMNVTHYAIKNECKCTGDLDLGWAPGEVGPDILYLRFLVVGDEAIVQVHWDISRYYYIVIAALALHCILCYRVEENQLEMHLTRTGCKTVCMVRLYRPFTVLMRRGIRTVDTKEWCQSEGEMTEG